MSLNIELVRAFLGAVFLIAYGTGLLFFMILRKDLKHFSMGYWAAAVVVIYLAPAIISYVLAAM